MKARFVRVIGIVIKMAGSAARRVVGAMAAALCAFIVLVIFVAFGMHMRLLPANTDPNGLFQLLLVFVILALGTVIGALVGLVWPKPFLSIAKVLEFLPVDFDF